MRKKKWLLCSCSFVLVIIIATLYIKDSNKPEIQEIMCEMPNKFDVLEIFNEEDYLDFAQAVSDGQTYENWEIELRRDLDFSQYENLKPIGDAGEKIEPVTFKGDFNGNGHTIYGIQMHQQDNDAGMFACLGGSVRNLQIKNSLFVGDKVGAIAADTDEASIYNCYIDAIIEGERAGMIVSRLSGMIVNCVTPIGERYEAIKKGGEYLCYNIDECDSTLLNQNLMFLSQYFNDTELCMWRNSGADIGLTKQEAELFQQVYANISANGIDLRLDGYFSLNQEKWCIALPATYMTQKIDLEICTTKNQRYELVKPEMQEEVVATINNINYPIYFLCADNLDTLYITLADQKTLSYVHENKYEEVPAIMTIFEQSGMVKQTVLKAFYGHGNDSWKENKKSYNLKFDDYVNLLGMGANEDFALLAGYRRNSLMSYVTTNELIQEIGFEYAPEFRLVNVYISGEYVGVYFLAEKIKIDKNRIDIPSVYKKAETIHSKSLTEFEYKAETWEGSYEQKYYYEGVNNPDDITGGYLLEIDNEDYGEFDSRFVTARNICVVLKRAMYSSKEQVEYISEFWQDFEDALYSEDGYNMKGKYYTDYIDMESFVMQWLMYELEQEISLNSSLYYYKESDISGDGLIHACYPWDIEHSYVLSEFNDEVWHTGKNSGALDHFWEMLYQHDDFKEAVAKMWKERFAPAVEKMLKEEPTVTESGLRNLNWYRQHMLDMHKLENSRWESAYPWNKMYDIEEFLAIRLNALTKLL